MKANWLYKVTSKSDKPVVVHQGGTSSSKTYSILQHLLTKAASQKDKVITVVGQDIPNLKVGAYRDAQAILHSESFFEQQLYDHNKSNRILAFATGSIIEFNSYSDEIDARSGKRTDSFFNEANGIPYGIYEQISLRTSEQVIIDFNPSAAFWAHEHLYGRDDVDWFNSTFRDNAFIDSKIKSKILSYEPTPENIAKGTANKYRWQVYGLGQVGRLEGLVFQDWQTTSQWPESYKWRIFGMDFGFSNSPTTLIEVRYAHGNLYAKQHMYQTGMTNSDISDRLKQINFDPKNKIVADSAEPKSIEELKRKGWHVVGAEKGTDSIRQGIDAMKRYSIYLHAKSKDLIEEFSSYQWKTDKDGNATNKPIDSNNHLVDGFRYALSKKILTPKPKPIQTALI